MNLKEQIETWAALFFPTLSRPCAIALIVQLLRRDGFIA